MIQDACQIVKGGSPKALILSPSQCDFQRPGLGFAQVQDAAHKIGPERRHGHLSAFPRGYHVPKAPEVAFGIQHDHRAGQLLHNGGGGCRFAGAGCPENADVPSQEARGDANATADQNGGLNGHFGFL